MSLMRDDRLHDGMFHLDLERGKTYTVTASGEAFMSDQTGVDADPFPGVVALYCTDEEDSFAERQIVLAPGKSITFGSPGGRQRLRDGVFPRHLGRPPQAGELYAHHRGDR